MKVILFVCLCMCTANLAESVDLEVKNHTETNGEKEMHLNLCLSARHIQHLHFPTYVPPDIKDDMVNIFVL